MKKASVYFDRERREIWAEDEKDGHISFGPESLMFADKPGMFDVSGQVCKAVMFLEDEMRVGPEEDRREVIMIVDMTYGEVYTPKEWFHETEEEE